MSRPQSHDQTSGGHDARLVRNACDACHTRKIRCVTPQAGGPCLHCQSKDLSCYFLPRYKSGRPRANAPWTEWAGDSGHSNSNRAVEVVMEPGLVQGRRRSRPSSPDCSEPAWSGKRHQQKNPSHRQDPLGTSSSHSFWGAYQCPSPSSTLPPLFHHDSPVLFASELPDLFGQDLFEQPAPTPTPAPPASPPSRLIDVAPVPRMRTGVSNETIETTTQSIARRCPPHEPGSQGRASENQFFVLLHHCGKLQHLIQAMSPVDLPTPAGESTLGTPELQGEAPDHLGEVLERVGSSCEAMLEMGRPMDLATWALVVAVACKVLQVFNIALSHQSLRVTTIKGMLVHKKLDLYLTQVRAVMEQIERESPNGPHVNKELSESYGFIRKRLASLYQETHA
ncbi:hypothetical protein PG991_006599 [Apiospora marii]|uniref:Zn(2)-C6 fungal-type domain-containing protein n=1 Tax=Apiospora marii TaxID=335849 RepID=A0ABR1S115_9PEZI